MSMEPWVRYLIYNGGPEILNTPTVSIPLRAEGRSLRLWTAYRMNASGRMVSKQGKTQRKTKQSKAIVCPGKG